MSAIITVRVKYNDNSASLTEDYSAAASNPSAEVIKDCEKQAVDKWLAMGKSGRDLEIHTKIRRV